MHWLLLAAFLASSLAEATSLRFKPDTVWTGYGALRYKALRASDSTTVTNTSSLVVDLKLKYLITPFKHSRNRVMYFAPSKQVYVYRFDSTTTLGNRFIQHLSRDTNYRATSVWTRMDIGDLKSPEIRLSPGRNAVLGKFRLDDCEVFPVRKMSPSAIQPTICQDEIIDIVFESSASNLDTLHGVMNSWASGLWNGSSPKDHRGSAGSRSRYSLDGKLLPWTVSGTIHDMGTIVPDAVGE